MVKVGVIGYGYWGPNLVRNFAEMDGWQLVSVCDERAQRLAQLQSRYPSVAALTGWRDLVADPHIDLVAIATPVCTHFELAMAAIRARKHVLIEKPIASSSDEALRLIEEADRQKVVLMVDHTFIYTGAVRKIKELISNGSLGEIYYYDSVRVNLGLFQHDVNVIWDLAVHDLAIMEFVLQHHPVAVSATGVSHIPGGREDVSYLTMFFDNQLIAHLHVNWLAPVKVRRTLIGGSSKMIVYDDVEPSEKVKVYDKGITFTNEAEGIHQLKVGYRAGDMWAPQLDMTEALKVEISHLLNCIQSGNRPLSDGVSGWQVVRLLEAAEESMKLQGRPVQMERRATA
jgi:predicted dehydrogenase